jgi:hypothetical protein
MARRGSTVRVRQRALSFCLLSRCFRCLGWRRLKPSASTQRPRFRRPALSSSRRRILCPPPSRASSAGADQRSFTPEHVDLSLIAEEAAETLLPLAEERGLTIETSGDTTPTIGSHPLLLQLSTNLVHNAIIHNLPEHGTVWITTSVHAKSAVLTVENSGEKLTPQSVATLAEPFQRGAERIRTDHAGVGLGLAIVKSIRKHTTEPSPSPPGRRRAPRHGATIRRATARRCRGLRPVAGSSARKGGGRLSASARSAKRGGHRQARPATKTSEPVSGRR